jgi:hypothetical protein
MNQPKKCIATKSLLLLAMMCAGSLAWAGQVAGTVGHLSGPLLAVTADGKVRILAQKSTFEQGETLVSERNTYAQLKFVDNSEVTLKPGTTFTIEQFAFDAGKPEADRATFTLVKGGLRMAGSPSGKRSRDRFTLATPSATIGILGATFIVDQVAPGPVALAAMQSWLLASTAGLGKEPPLAPLQLAQLSVLKPPGNILPPGLYVQVIDGLINVSNKGGTQNFAAGQFGFTPNPIQPPTIVPKNPGLLFTPPQAFSAPVGPASGSGSANKPAAVDCEVR